jgi:short subunit dehydrogenase-like uncharacterized protein
MMQEMEANTMSDKPWMIYGATGETGSMMVEEALGRGHRPLVAGRSAEKVRALAERHGLPWAVVSLDDPAGLRAALGSVSLVLNAAGPFTATSEAFMDACLAVGAHYLDIANEIPVFQAASARHAAATARDIVIMPGVGFGAVVADSLARHLAERAPDAISLEIALLPYNRGGGAGATRTAFAIMAGSGYVWRDGRLVALTLGAGGRRLTTPQGQQTILPVPTGDLVAAAQTTGIANVTVYLAFPLPPLAARVALRLFGRALAIPALRRMLEPRDTSPIAAPVAQQDAAPDQRSYAWARATRPDGQAIEAWLEMGEGYAFTAASAVRSAEQVLALQPRGALTAARAFGADALLGIPGVRRYDGMIAAIGDGGIQGPISAPPTASRP